MSSDTDRPDGQTPADEIPEAPENSTPGTQRHPAVIATAVALPVALIVAILVIAVMSQQTPAREPLAVGSAPAPAAGSPDCTELLGALPSSLGDEYTESELAQPAPAGVAAWQLPEGDNAIVLRCGLERPLEFTAASALQVVNGVSWLEVRDEATGAGSGTWYAVDRGTYIAVTMPDQTGPSPIQEISNTITAHLPAKPMDPGPVPN